MKKYFLLIILLFGLSLTGCLEDPIDDPDPPVNGGNEPPIDDNGGNPDLSHLFEETDNYVVYINLDGFARYYYDLAVEKNRIKTLPKLIDEGVFFDNLYNLTPSITNPVQAMIISGASSSQTHNVYRYFDKTKNVVVQQGRENEAETIYEVAVKSNIPVISVRHFPSEAVLSTTDFEKLYVTEESGVVADATVRFDQAIRIVKGEEFTTGSHTYTVPEVPRLLTLYCDDLDAIGHNESNSYGFTTTVTEEGRLNNVLDSLENIDNKLQDLIDAYKFRGIYDKTTFFITTDHGMTPFGADSIIGALTSKYARSKWPDLRDKLKAINSSYVFEYLPAGKSPSKTTTVVGVSGGLQMQLTFIGKNLTENDLQSIKTKLLEEEYIGDVFTRNEMIRKGYWSGANVDLLVVPSERYHFHGQASPTTRYSVRGQHDTYHETSRHIYGIIWGYRVEKIGIYEPDVTVTSFGVSMAETLGFALKNANAKRIDIFTKLNNNSQ